MASWSARLGNALVPLFSAPEPQKRHATHANTNRLRDGSMPGTFPSGSVRRQDSLENRPLSSSSRPGTDEVSPDPYLTDPDPTLRPTPEEPTARDAGWNPTNTTDSEQQSASGPPADTIARKPPAPSQYYVRPHDVVIAVMGVTGAGKSTFINYLSEFDVEIGHNMESCTNKVAVYPVTLPDGRNIYLLDTPGFDDTYKSDTDVLREIAAWLQDAHAHKVLLSGLVYLHRIQDVRFTGAAMKNLRMFKKLCGHEGLKNVILATTFWNKVTPEEGSSREAQLRSEKAFWKSMIDEGSQMIRHDGEATTALQIIDRLVQKKTTIELAIQREMQGGMTLDQTAAGKEVEAQVERMRMQWEKEKKDLEADMKEALAAHDKEAQRQIKIEREEIDQKILESDRSMKRLQATNSQLAEQLRSQRQEMSNKMRLLNHLENREEKRERKFYRKYNPLHKRYDEI